MTSDTRVHQRVGEGGHSVPEDRIEPGIDRLVQHVKKIIELGLADEVHILDNSDFNNSFVRVLMIANGEVNVSKTPLPEWAKTFLAL